MLRHSHVFLSCVAIFAYLCLYTLLGRSDPDDGDFIPKHDPTDHVTTTTTPSTSKDAVVLPLQRYPFQRISSPSRVSAILRSVISDFAGVGNASCELDPFWRAVPCVLYFEYATWNAHIMAFLSLRMPELISLAQRGIENGELAILTVDYSNDLHNGEIKIIPVDEVDHNAPSQRIIIFARGTGKGKRSHFRDIWNDIPRFCPSTAFLQGDQNKDIH